MQVREPVVAGRFYPAFPKPCRSDIERLLGELPAAPPQSAGLIAGLVPHAGWMCSGAVAAEVFARLAAARAPSVIVLFGGVHHYRGRSAALFGSGRWETPLGPAEVDVRLGERILGHTNLIVDDSYAHEMEHSIEVQMPFVVHLFPGVKVVPVMVPPSTTAHQVGEIVGRTIKAYGYDALIVGTTDLTHYGPSYNFEPRGHGPAALAWAKEENDTGFIDLVCRMRGDDLVPEATRKRNACSSGAAAATVGAAAMLGATEGVLLRHTTSAEVLAGSGPPETSDAVGYAGIVFS